MGSAGAATPTGTASPFGGATASRAPGQPGVVGDALPPGPMGRQPMGGNQVASTANAGAHAGRIGAQPTPAGTAPGARPALSQAVPAGGWAQTAPLRNTYRMGGGGMAMGSFMALPPTITTATSGVGRDGRPLAIPTATFAPAPAAPETSTGPTYKTRQELGSSKARVVGTWTDENGVPHQTVQTDDGTIYADTAQGFRPLSEAELNSQPGSRIELTSKTDAAPPPPPPDPNLLTDNPADLRALADRAEARGDDELAAAYRSRADRAEAAQQSSGVASSSAGLSAASGSPPPAGTPPPVQTTNRINAPAGGSNADLGGGGAPAASSAPAAAPAAAPAPAPAQSQPATGAPAQPAPDPAQARQKFWFEHGGGAGLPDDWRGNGQGVWGKGPGGRSIFATWEDIAAGRVPKAGEEEDDLAWSNLQGFAQRMLEAGQTGPSASDKLREDILAPLPETPRMSQEERQRQLQNIDLGLRQQAANRARAMMQGGGFANAESQAGVMAEMGLQNDANITQQRSARELAFALDDLSAERQDHANQLMQIQQALALSTNDYERQRLLETQRQLMQSQAGIDAMMAAYQRQLSKPDLGESLAGLFGGAIGGLLTAPIGGIGMGIGSGLGNLIGGAISGPSQGDQFLQLLQSLRR